MSEPAVFALIRDGERRYYVDRWASATLRREVLWGPEDFEGWVTQFEQLDEWDDCGDGGAVVDFDKQTMLWSGDVTSYTVPRIWQTYHRLLEVAWPGFQIKFSRNGIEDFAAYLGVPRNEADDEDYDDEEDEQEEHEPRPLMIHEARLDDPDDPEDEADELDEEDDGPRAWITLVDEDGSTRQRQLRELSLDLLKGEAAALDAIVSLTPAVIPKEAQVSEGLLINPAKKTARIWGSPELLIRMKSLGKLWKGWQLKWTHRGYAEQCAASGTQGMPMNEIDVLARILPLVLSTEQFSFGAVMDVLGGGVKKFAKKATGCLIFVLCLPLALFGFFSGNWMAMLYAMGGTVVVVVGLYLLIARRFKKAVTKSVPHQANDESTTLVAGPQEEDARKARIDQLLTKAKLPKLAEVEPHFPDVKGLEILAT